MSEQIEIRAERPADYRKVEELTREAFWNTYEPGCNEHYLAHQLRTSKGFIKELDMVAVAGGKIAGNIMYSHGHIACDDGRKVPVICFGPLSVHPDFQGLGIGGKLIEHTKRLARELGHRAIVICGDPAYYSRFGFVPAEVYDVAMPGNIYAPALQILDLTEVGLEPLHGIFIDDEAFHIDMASAEAFDLDFPPKEKRSGAGQQERFNFLISQMRERTGR